MGSDLDRSLKLLGGLFQHSGGSGLHLRDIKTSLAGMLPTSGSGLMLLMMIFAVV